MSKASVTSIKVLKINNGTGSEELDLLANEEPLELRLGYGLKSNRQQKSVSITMRTPGHDFELALGFLYTEGIIEDVNQITQIIYCTELNTKQTNENIVRVELSENVKLDFDKLQRNFYTTSSCGICGKASIDAIKTVCNIVPNNEAFIVHQSTLLLLSEKLRAEQNIFEYTGGLHACALFDAEGNLLLLREDVGRHNALDKLIGAVIGSKNEAYNFKNKILLLSGRASFELIQKAAMAGFEIICAIGAPSSLAVQTAHEFNITLIGFLKQNRFNVYTHSQRIVLT